MRNRIDKILTDSIRDSGGDYKVVIARESLGKFPPFLVLICEQIERLLIKILKFNFDHFQVYSEYYVELAKEKKLNSSQLNEVD